MAGFILCALERDWHCFEATLNQAILNVLRTLGVVLDAILRVIFGVRCDVFYKKLYKMILKRRSCPI